MLVLCLFSVLPVDSLFLPKLEFFLLIQAKQTSIPLKMTKPLLTHLSLSLVIIVNNNTGHVKMQIIELQQLHTSEV